MEMEDSEQINSVKVVSQFKASRGDKIMVYIIDICLSLIFLESGIIAITLLFTSSLNIVPNITQIIIIIFIAITFWVLFHRNKDNYSYKNISYSKIILKSKKTSFHTYIKLMIDNYYLLIYIFIFIVAILISALRKIEIAAFGIIFAGCAGMIIFHLKFNIYIEGLNNKRSILNNCALAAIMILHMIGASTVSSSSTGIAIVMVIYVILLLLLAANVFIFVLLTKK